MANPKWKEWTEPDKLILLEGWARDGLTYEQIAHNMNINVTTFQKWKASIKSDDDEKSKIFKALKKGRAVADYEVENALFKSACGFYVEEEVQERDPDTGLMFVTKRTKKFVPPNSTSQIFWLKNRKPAEWRDKREHVIEDDESTSAGIIIIPAVQEGHEYEPDKAK